MLQFRDTAAAKLSSFAILERVLRDQFEIVDDECGDRDAKRAAIRDPKDVPCDTVGNAETGKYSSPNRKDLYKHAIGQQLFTAPSTFGYSSKR